MRPTRGQAGHPTSPYSALLQVRFSRPKRHRWGRELLPRDFTLAQGINLLGGMFLWHYLSGYPAWALPSTLPGGARTFLCTYSYGSGRPATLAQHQCITVDLSIPYPRYGNPICFELVHGKPLTG